jgi:hypothetical protein
MQDIWVVDGVVPLQNLGVWRLSTLTFPGQRCMFAQICVAFIGCHRGMCALREVSAKNHWDEFIRSMLTGFHMLPKATKETLFKVIELLQAAKDQVRARHRKIYTAELVEVTCPPKNDPRMN